MNFKKIGIIAVTVLLVLVIAVSAGCTSTSTTTTTPSTTTSNEISGSVTVLAATSLTKAMDEVIAGFEEKNKKIDVTASYGGSNSLVTQMTSGAVDADVFFSADEANMKKVIDAKLTNDSNVLLNNSLVCVVTKGNPKNISAIGDLAKDGIEIASGVDGVPFASYGTGVAEKYENDGNIGFKDKFLKNITYRGSNVAEARTAVVLGECDAAIIYKTDVAGFEDKLDVIEIPVKYNTVTKLPYTILTASKDNPAVLEFVKYMTGEEGLKIFKKHGFVISS